MFCSNCGSELTLQNIADNICLVCFKTLKQTNINNSIVPQITINQNNNSNRSIETDDRIPTWNIVFGYIMAIFLPLIGLLFGIYFMFKKLPGHGIIISFISIIMMIIFTLAQL